MDAQVRTWADGFGLWHAQVTRTDSPRTVEGTRIAKRRARAAIVRDCAADERKTWETDAEARRRVSATLGRLRIVADDETGTTWQECP